MSEFKNGQFKDCKGRIVEEFDVLKVFHFIGSRNKKHYMYKWARVKDGYLQFRHLMSDDGYFDPRSAVDKETGLMPEIEIVQSPNWEKL